MGFADMEKTLKLLGKRIAELRSKRGITQEKLAELADYSPNHISKIESARTKPSFDLLYAIAKVLDVELKDLLNFDEYKDINEIKEEFKTLMERENTKTLKLMYKFYNTLEK